MKVTKRYKKIHQPIQIVTFCYISVARRGGSPAAHHRNKRQRVAILQLLRQRDFLVVYDGARHVGRGNFNLFHQLLNRLAGFDLNWFVLKVRPPEGVRRFYVNDHDNLLVPEEPIEVHMGEATVFVTLKKKSGAHFYRDTLFFIRRRGDYKIK